MLQNKTRSKCLQLLEYGNIYCHNVYGAITGWFNLIVLNIEEGSVLFILVINFCLFSLYTQSTPMNLHIAVPWTLLTWQDNDTKKNIDLFQVKRGLLSPHPL